jgi:hypothetical protein
MVKVSAGRFTSALNKLAKPGGKQMQFLRAHYKARGRALTAKRLAQKVGYKNYRAINRLYGLLAAKMGPLVGQPNSDIDLLVESAPPKSITNKEWILIMRPEFAAGLKRAGWV